MLYYKDNIPDLEHCEIKEDDGVTDATIANVRNNYATKMLLDLKQAAAFNVYSEGNKLNIRNLCKSILYLSYYNL